LKTRWTLPAVNSLQNIFQHIASDNQEAAHRVVRRIHEAVERAAQMPFSARAGKRAGTRELVVSGTPYIVVYRIREEGIQILRIVHGAQNGK
jgi:addiction module RelE/StbE family toxin